MSSLEWSRYMRDSLGVPMEPEEISRAVVARLEQSYRERVPLLPGAEEAVRATAERWALGLASSANRPLIDLVLELTGLAPLFSVTVSSEEVPRGKPGPDVYLEAADRLQLEPTRCAAVEDSANGIRSASSAGMRVVAIRGPSSGRRRTRSGAPTRCSTRSRSSFPHSSESPELWSRARSR